MGSHHGSLKKAGQIPGGCYRWSAGPAPADESQHLANGGPAPPVERQELVSGHGEHPSGQESLMHLPEHGPHARVGRMAG
jgi:hypothetical protein